MLQLCATLTGGSHDIRKGFHCLGYGKPVYAEYDQIEIGYNEELDRGAELLAGWEPDCTADSVFEARADLEELWKLMVEKSGLNIWDTMTTGESGLTFIEHVDPSTPSTVRTR